MSLGLAGTNIYTWLDGKVLKAMSGYIKNWMICGLRERKSFFPRVVGEPRPVFYTYKMIIEKLGNFDSAKKVNTGRDDVKAYKFTVKNKTIYCLWYDDGIAQKPGDDEPSITIDLSSDLDYEIAKTTSVITKFGQTSPEVEHQPSNNITLTETPILIEPIGY